MTFLSLRDAARDAGTSKSSLHRAIKAGRLSATRTETGELRIDPSELARAYPPRSSQPSQAARAGPEPVGCDGIGHSAPLGRDGTGGLAARCAAAEAEVRVLRQMLDDMRAERVDLKSDRDAWRGQAERLALAPPLRRGLLAWLRR